MPVMIYGTKLSYVAQEMSYALFLTIAGAPLHILKGQNHEARRMEAAGNRNHITKEVNYYTYGHLLKIT